MSDDQAGLGVEAVGFLLELLELRQPLLSGAAAELCPAPAKRLIAAGLLIPHDHETVSASLADHDDAPVSLIWSDQHAALAYFSSAVGLVPVPRERLLRQRVAVEAVLSALIGSLDLAKGHRPFALVEDLLWEVGDVRLGKNPVRTSVWFARRIFDRDVLQRVTEMARSRPHTRPRLILTSTRPIRLAGLAVPGAAIIGVKDVLALPGALAISPDILSARFSGVALPTQGPLVLSPDRTKLSIRGGEPILFRSEAQQEVIKQLVDAFYDGTRLRARDLTHHHSLQTFFGKAKWVQLEPFLKSTGGLWGFDL